MNKEEILERSRKENKGQDIYEQEVLKEGEGVGGFAAMMLATVFFVVQLIVGRGRNWGLWAIMLIYSASEVTVKAVRLRKKHEIILAVFYWVVVLLMSGCHIYELVTG